MFQSLRDHFTAVYDDMGNLYGAVNLALKKLKETGVGEIPDYFPIQLKNTFISSNWKELDLGLTTGRFYGLDTGGERATFNYQQAGDVCDDTEVCFNLKVSFPASWFEKTNDQILYDISLAVARAKEDSSKVNQFLEDEAQKQIEAKERALLAKLKAKYE